MKVSTAIWMGLLLVLVLGLGFGSALGPGAGDSTRHLLLDPQIVVDPDRPDRWYAAIGGVRSGIGRTDAVHAYDGAELAWRSEVRSSDTITPVVVAAGGGFVYVVGAAGLVALDADSGAQAPGATALGASAAAGSYRYDEERGLVVVLGHEGGATGQVAPGELETAPADERTRERWASARIGDHRDEWSRRLSVAPEEESAFQGPAGGYALSGDPRSLTLDGAVRGEIEAGKDARFLLRQRLLPCGAPEASPVPEEPSATLFKDGECPAGLVAPGAETGYVLVWDWRRQRLSLLSLEDGSVPVSERADEFLRSVFALPDGSVGVVDGEDLIRVLRPDGSAARIDVKANEAERVPD
ncbi:MAG: hypothetical protein Q4E05_06520 [Pseudoclavibacter sp.]|nr:hypothetical protein [Pseudoclavibacter sp.]